MTMQFTEAQIQEAKEVVPTITCEAFFGLEQKGELPLVLDVRTDEEYNSGHIDYSTHLPLDQLDPGIDQVAPSKSQEIIICCARGNRAAIAGKILMDMDYTNVKYLSGGYTGYCGAGDKAEGEEEEQPMDI